MQITSVSAVQSPTKYNTKNSNRTSFCGMTKMFEKTVYHLPYQRAEYIVSQYPKPNFFVGYFPKDILGILKKSASGKELKQNIQSFNKELSNMAVRIRTNDNKVFKQLDNINLDDYNYRALAQATQKGKNSHIGWVSEKLEFFPTVDEMENLLKTSDFEKTVKKIGLIPEDGKVGYTFVGKGTYKNVLNSTF